ncbi:hypothetical protein ATE92_0348 [Ulvibacter sp. MAR_2010_11]|uniref:hypothetical protein n=1 Tax=Ulvibacter sp. MAR_2010_11 TaxID=1250229 RepID=UPI000C2C8F4F|nr:hypothetical protein [Ulvibacter sp. MAR_2010_11]PKA82222.1 hypothetical protein ATE92_0348 [Ulvibacter sp. MAR_2010_11]
MNKILVFASGIILLLSGCKKSENLNLSLAEKEAIKKQIETDLAAGINATIHKDIDGYMDRLPEDLIIYDESGEEISRETQREYALRDWSIIDTTLVIKMEIDSIQYLKRDSIFVYTSQYWKRMMFQRDGITLDTVVTTQKHKETWKKNKKGWFGYTIEELGGTIYINGELYKE